MQEGIWTLKRYPLFLPCLFAPLFFFFLQLYSSSMQVSKLDQFLSKLSSGEVEVVEYEEDPEGAKKLVEELEKCPDVQTIRLRSRSALAVVFRKTPSLMRFELRNNDIGDEVTKALAEAFSKMPNLTSITLLGNKIGDKGAKALARAFSKMPNLTSIDLRYNKIDDEGVKALSVAFSKLPNLASIYLGNNNFAVKGSKALAGAFSKMPNLRTIDLRNNKIGVEGAEALAEGFSKMPSLTSITLGGDNFGDEGAKALAESFSKMPNLIRIRLLNTKIGDEAAKALAEGFSKMPKLTSIVLEFNEIGDDGAKALAGAFSKMPNLTSINLGYNEFGDEGAKALAESFAKLPSLTNINLAKNGIGDEGAKALAESFSKMPNLTSIVLCDNEIGVEGAKALAEVLAKSLLITYMSVDSVWVDDSDSKFNHLFSDILARNCERRKKFRSSAAEGNLAAVKEFLDAGVDAVSLDDDDDDEERRVFHIAIDAGHWSVVEMLLQNSLCRSVLGLPTETRSSARDEILEKCPDEWRARILSMLPRRSIAAISLPNMVKDFVGICSLLKDEWSSLEAIVDDVHFRDARGRTMAHEVNLKQLHEGLAALEKVEEMPVSDVIGFQQRHAEREKMLQLINLTNQGVASFLQASGCELDLLVRFKKQEAKSDMVNSEPFDVVLARAKGLFMDAEATLQNVRQLEQNMKEQAEALAKQFSWEGAEMLQHRIASAIKALKDAFFAVDFFQAMQLVKQCQSMAFQQHREREQHLRQQRSEIVQFAQTMNAKRSELEKTIAAAGQIEAVKTKVSDSMKRLNLSKRELTRCGLEVEDAREVGTEEDVEQAKAKVASANAKVAESRNVYEAAVTDMVELRQAGYPELQCAAAAKVDRFPNVPSVSFNDLTVVGEIGGGSFADVLKVELPVTGMCAFKKLRSKMPDEELMKEAAALWEMRFSDHVVKLLMVCREPGKQGLLLELADGGSLGDRLHKRKERLKEPEMLQILHDVAAGLECVHHHKHVHLDVKADNVLLFGSRAKLADFGTAKEARNTYRDTKVALSFQWSAPEMLATMPKISSACDIWSFGMFMYEILTGSVPFEHVERHGLVQAICRGELPAIPVQGIRPKLVQLMQKCWNRDPSKRPTAVDLMNEIGSLMSVMCCSCADTWSLTKGVFGQKMFLCFACVPATVSANLASRTIRSDGALVLGRDENQDVFELQSFRNLLSKEELAAWLKGQADAAEMEVKKRLEAELEREKRKWDAMSVDERIANCIRFDVLPSRCPKCKERLVYEGGCFALSCGSCEAKFCAFCESVFVDGLASHDHVQNCKQNVLKVPWYPNANLQKETFGRVQRVRQIREIKKRLENVDEDTRKKVIDRIKNELELHGISEKDLK